MVAAGFFFFTGSHISRAYLIKLTTENYRQHCDNYPTSLLRMRSGQAVLQGLVEMFVSGAERKITRVRGCGKLKGSRQTKHLGQVDLDVWSLKGAIVCWPTFYFVTHRRGGDSAVQSAVMRVRTADRMSV